MLISPTLLVPRRVGAVTCMNLNGSDFWGAPYQANPLPTVKLGGVLPLWVSVNVPQGAAPCSYSGKATVTVRPTAAPAAPDTTDTTADTTADTATVDMVVGVVKSRCRGGHSRR